MKVRATIGYGYVGTYRNEILEFADDTTNEEIDEYIWELATQQVDIGWERMEEKED